MKLQRKGTRHSHRGVIGVESAIVMIAFVIVAAALAFVVLNMGFTTSQKAKTSIISSLNEAGGSMQIAGKIIGAADTSAAHLQAVAIPIKIASGGNDVNLDNSTAVKFVSTQIDYDNTYLGVMTAAEYKSLKSAGVAALTKYTDVDSNVVTSGTSNSNTRSFIYFSQADGGTVDEVLEEGETAVLATFFESGFEPDALDKIKFELIVPTGASLTVERQVPSLSTSIIDLG